MAELNLLPRKEFEIHFKEAVNPDLTNKVIKGQFSLWSVKRYCDKKKLSLSGLALQMEESSMSLDDMALMLLCAVEYTSKKNKEGFAYSDIDACDWIEELGGLTGEKYLELMNHANSEISNNDTGEKKS